MSTIRRRILASKRTSQPPSEWVLLVESNEFIGDISTDQKTFGPSISWVEGKQYKLEGTIEVTSMTAPGQRVRITDGNTQSAVVLNTNDAYVGYTKDFSEIVISTRTRSRAVLIGRIYDDNTYIVKVTNFKAYEHI